MHVFPGVELGSRHLKYFSVEQLVNSVVSDACRLFNFDLSKRYQMHVGYTTLFCQNV